MKFNKGDKVIFIKHTKPVFDLVSISNKMFTLGEEYVIDRIACRKDKTYTIVGVKSGFIYENQVRLKTLQ